jgi:hypothetical protein
MADYEATPELVARLKKGQMLQIQAIIRLGSAGSSSCYLRHREA